MLRNDKCKLSSDAHPDPGSGAFLTPGSGMGKKSRSGSEIKVSDHIFESLETIFWVKILKFFDADVDPGVFFTLDLGSGTEQLRIRDNHPGSATLVPVMRRERKEMIGLMISSQAQHQDGEPGSQYV